MDFAINVTVGSLPLALRADGDSPTAISLVVGSGSIVSLFGSLPVGALVDRVGRVPTIRVAGTLAVGVALRSIALVAYTSVPLGRGVGLGHRRRRLRHARRLHGGDHRVRVLRDRGIAGVTLLSPPRGRRPRGVRAPAAAA